jgi:hypothetical protein
VEGTFPIPYHIISISVAAVSRVTEVYLALGESQKDKSRCLAGY